MIFHITSYITENSFGDMVENIFKMANLHNYKFSILGCLYDNVSTTQSSFLEDELNLNNKNAFSFSCFTSVECKIELLKLNCIKPVGPSDIPA